MPQFSRRVHSLIRNEYLSVKKVYYLSVSLMIFLLGWSLVDPFFSIAVNNVLQNATLLGVFLALWGLIRIFTDAFLGGFFDYIDNKKIILASLIGYVLVGLGYYFINDAVNLFLLRVFHVFCGSVFWVGVWSYTHHLAPPKKREQNIRFETIMSTVPTLFTPFIGAFVFSLSNPKLVYLAVPIGSALAFLILFFKGEPTRTKKSFTINRVLKSEFSVIKKQKKKIAALFYILIPLMVISSAFYLFLPVYLFSKGYGAYVVALTTVVTILPTIIMMPLGKRSDRHGRMPIFLAGSLLTTLGLLTFSYSGTVFQIIMSTFIIGAGIAILVPTSNSLVGDLAGRNKGVITGVAETGKDLGQIIGSLLGGVVVSLTNFETLTLLLSAAPVFLLFMVLFFKKSAD